MNISIADIATLLTITLVAVGFISWLTRRWINELIEKQVQPQLDSDSESMRLAGLVAEHSRDAALAAQQAALEARDADRYRMSKVAAFFAGIGKVLSVYPAASASLLNFGVVLAAFFGLHVTGDQLMYVVGVVTVLFGSVVHSNVTPLARPSVEPVEIVEIVNEKESNG